MTDDAAAAFVGDSADDAAAESRLAVRLDDWDECRVGTEGTHDATIGGTTDVGSFPSLITAETKSQQQQKKGGGGGVMWRVMAASKKVFFGF